MDLSELLRAWVVVRWRSQQVFRGDGLLLHYFDGQQWNKVKTLDATQGVGGWRFALCSLDGFELSADGELDFTAHVSEGASVHLDAIWVLGDSIGDRRVSLNVSRQSGDGLVEVRYHASSTTLSSGAELILQDTDPSQELRFRFNGSATSIQNN